MPQLSIEYSANLGDAFDAPAFARALHEKLVAHADAELANCKTRIVKLQDFLIGDGAPENGMVHVDMRILPGRSEDQKRSLGEAVILALDKSASGAAGFDIQLTVEVGELDGANYHKRRIGR